MSQPQQRTLLVTGASGHFGRQVVELLVEAGTDHVIAATRSPEKLADLQARGVETRYASFDEPESLAGAFTGVDRLLLISTDVTGQGDRRLEQHRAAVRAAEQAGVQHVLYTSITNPAADTPIILALDHYGTEQALEASSMGYTFLRNNIYTEILIGSINQALQFGGKLFAAAGDGRNAYVTREDCARAAAAALASSFEGRRALDITGPEALTQYDVARIGSEITGQPITYIPLDFETLVGNMVGAGLPRPIAEAYASFDKGTAQGVLDLVSEDFETLTGRKPTSVREFLTEHRDLLGAPPAG